jgi:hypothetical protein
VKARLAAGNIVRQSARLSIMVKFRILNRSTRIIAPKKRTDIAMVSHPVRSRWNHSSSYGDECRPIKICAQLCTGILDDGLHRRLTVPQMEHWMPRIKPTRWRMPVGKLLQSLTEKAASIFRLFQQLERFFVMPGLVPGIHVLLRLGQERRGWPGQARP